MPSGADNCFDIVLWRLPTSKALTKTRPSPTARARDYQAWITRVVTNDAAATVSIVVEHRTTERHNKQWERVAMDINYDILLERSPMLARLVTQIPKGRGKDTRACAKRARACGQKGGASAAVGLLHRLYDKSLATGPARRREFELDLGTELEEDFIGGNPAVAAHLNSVKFALLQSGAAARVRRSGAERTRRLERTAEGTSDDVLRVGTIIAELTSAAKVMDVAMEKILFAPLAEIREQTLDPILLKAFPEGSFHRLMALDAAGKNRTGNKSAPKRRTHEQKLRGILLGYVNIACGVSQNNGVHYRIVRTIIRFDGPERRGEYSKTNHIRHSRRRAKRTDKDEHDARVVESVDDAFRLRRRIRALAGDIAWSVDVDRNVRATERLDLLHRPLVVEADADLHSRAHRGRCGGRHGANRRGVVVPCLDRRPQFAEARKVRPEPYTPL
jgi:hypothetical protein